MSRNSNCRLASEHQRLLQPLRALTAGFSVGVPEMPLAAEACLTVLYCVKGRGWCELAGRKAPLRSGDLILVSPGPLPRLGSAGREPCHFNWVQAAGDLLPDYVAALGLDRGSAAVWHAGLDPQLTRLFGEVSRNLAHADQSAWLLGAAHALGSLMAAIIQKRRHAPVHPAGVPEKVAEAITWMSEHLDESWRVGDLARAAGLSGDHFASLFRRQTGSSPCEYRHLLRMHRARELLTTSPLSIKEIARQLGYADPFHFSRQFKRFEGVSPLRFRQAS